MTIGAVDIAAHNGIHQTYFTVGVKSTAQVNLAPDVDHLRVERQLVFLAGSDPAAAAVELAADTGPANINGALRTEAIGKLRVGRDAGIAGVDRGLVAARDEPGVGTTERVSDLRADEPHLTHRVKAVAKFYVATDF